MKPTLITALITAFFLTTSAFAQDKATTKREPSEKQKAQQERMKDCNAKAGDKKGEDRKGFMSSCLAGKEATPTATPAQQAQRDKMASCNKEASGKNLKGKERQTFMSGCLKG
jgi:Ni/Co efflux regulator RcnB